MNEETKALEKASENWGAPTVLQQMTAAEIDVAIETAKKYPRSIKKFLNDAYEMATFDEETAAGCFYNLPKRDQDGKRIEGPSVRLAEIMASAWGNIHFGARIIEEADRHVTAYGTCKDLEKNVTVAIEVRRRITKKDGTRYGDDMITVTCNAACSIVLRNAVFKIVPGIFVKRLMREAQKAAIGKGKTLEGRRSELLAFFGKSGITEDQIFAELEIDGAADMGIEQIRYLIGLKTAIKEGDTTLAQAFPDKAEALKRRRLQAKLHAGGKRADEPDTEPPEAQDEPETTKTTENGETEQRKALRLKFHALGHKVHPKYWDDVRADVIAKEYPGRSSMTELDDEELLFMIEVLKRLEAELAEAAGESTQ